MCQSFNFETIQTKTFWSCKRLLVRQGDGAFCQISLTTYYNNNNNNYYGICTQGTNRNNPKHKLKTTHKAVLVCAIIITGPPNGPVLFCSLASSVVVCNAAGGRADRPPGAWAVGWPTLHGGPVRLRLVRATSCYYRFLMCNSGRQRS